jgi:hypothetical protein
MTYTFWHSGILIGESDLDEPTDNPRRRAGVFRPTPYGLEVFPRLGGTLFAGHDLKTYLDANGLDPDEMERDEIEELLDTHPAGQRIIEIGRMLSEVEMRADDGQRLAFESIAFMDMQEWEEVFRELEARSADDPRSLRPDGSRYIVSTTLRDSAPRTEPARQLVCFPPRRSSADN